MVISEERALERLSHKDNVLVRLSLSGSGGRDGKGNVSPETRAFIGTLANLTTLGPKKIGEMTGLSRETVDGYKKGEVSSYRDPELYKTVKSNVEEHKENAKGLAVENLLKALNVVGAKVSGAKLGEASQVAKDSALILEKLSPVEKDNGPMVARVVIKYPEVRPEEQYATVDVTVGVK